MELALTTLLLLPGLLSLALATGPRCRATAPRDLPAALVATLGFALINFYLSVLAYKCLWGTEDLWQLVAALFTDNPSGAHSPRRVFVEILDPSKRHLRLIAVIGVVSWSTGLIGSQVYQRLLRIIARKELNIPETRTLVGRILDDALELFHVPYLVLARGASYWLVVEQGATLLSRNQPEVYADISQGEEATLFAGQVAQVITSRSGETISVVLKGACRYRRSVYGPPTANGTRQVIEKGGWKKIGDSEAFYLRGESINNISYRIYGDPARGGYEKFRAGNQEWAVHESILQILQSGSREKRKR